MTLSKLEKKGLKSSFHDEMDAVFKEIVAKQKEIENSESQSQSYKDKISYELAMLLAKETAFERSISILEEYGLL